MCLVKGSMGFEKISVKVTQTKTQVNIMERILKAVIKYQIG